MPFTVHEFPTPIEGDGTAYDGVSKIWSAHQQGTTLSLFSVDKTTGAVIDSFSVTVTGNGVSDAPLAIAGGFLWVAELGAAKLAQITTAGALLNEFNVTTAVNSNPTGNCITTDGTDLYVGFQYLNAGLVSTAAVSKMTQAGVIVWNEVFTGQVQIGGITLDATPNVWIGGFNNPDVFQLSGATGAVIQTASLPGTFPGGVAYHGGLVWSIDQNNNQLDQIDAATATLLNTFNLTGGAAGFPYQVATDTSGNVWTIGQDAIGAFHIQVFTSAGAPLEDFTSDLTDGGLSFTFDGSNMWTPGLDAASNPVILQMGFGAAAAAPHFVGTYIGFMRAGQFSGGTK